MLVLHVRGPLLEPGAAHNSLFLEILSFFLIFIGSASSNPPGGGSKLAPLQQSSTVIPPIPGGLYGDSEGPQGGGEWRKVAEICLN